MAAIFRREFRSYFTGMIGPVVVALLLLFLGLYYSVYNVISGNPYFGRAISGAAGYLIVIIPLLTMRSLPEEKKTKTDQMLFTAPVSTTEVVLGKYFAMLAVFSIPVLISCVFPVILGTKPSHSYLIDYSSIAAFVLLGAAYIAIGMFISSLTESQIIAAIMTFAAFFLMSMAPTLAGFIPETTYINAIGFCVIAVIFALIINHLVKNLYISGGFLLIACAAVWIIYFIKGDIYAGALSKLLSLITFQNGITYFAAGVFDVTAVVMFISIAVFFVFLTILALQRRRQSSLKSGIYTACVSALVAVIAVVVNLVAGQLPESVKNIDISQAQLFSIGDTTKSIVRALEEDVTVYVLAKDGQEDKTVMQMLGKYTDQSSRVKVSVIDPDKNPVLLKNNNLSAEDLSGYTDLLVVSAKRSKFISYRSIYSYLYGDNAYYMYMYYGDTQYLATNYCGEKLVTSAISYVTTDDLPKMYTLTGHGEVGFTSAISSLLAENNYVVEDLNLISQAAVPEDCDVLAIIDPSSDLTEEEMTLIQNYIVHGGDCIIINYSGKQKDMLNYNRLLAYYGVVVHSDGYVFEPAGYNYNQVAWTLYEPVSQAHEITKNIKNGAVLTSYVQPILQYDDKRNTLKIETLISSSAGSWYRTDLESKLYNEKIDSDVDGPFDLAVLITDQTNEGEGRIVLFSTYDIIASKYVEGNQPFANAEVFINSVNYLCSLSTTISIPAKSADTKLNAVSTSDYYVSLAIFVIILPVIILITGFVIWFRRRRR
ncbi:MAG: Gldg family protein [Lachnospiraceae bacterium]|nr:Gldg family protein [Lachnospiraceae bacterium]